MLLFSLIIGALSGFLAMLPLLIMYHLVIVKKNNWNFKILRTHLIVAYIFCFFLAAILSVTGVPSFLYLRVNININLIPFKDIFSNFIQYVENIILFIPLGFLLPILWAKFEKRYLTFIIGLLFSLAIEISQLFCFRATDIDDLLMNTFGTVVGYYLYIGTKKVYPKIATLFKVNGLNFLKWEVYIYFVFAWLTMFFAQTFISNWFWSFILT